MLFLLLAAPAYGQATQATIDGMDKKLDAILKALQIGPITTPPVIVPPPPPPPPIDVPPVVGASYYLATNGDDTNPGTLALPFKTIQKSAPLLKPGQTLIVRGGEYDTGNLSLTSDGNQTIIPSGTSWANAVTIKAYPGEKVAWRRYLSTSTCCNLYGGQTSGFTDIPGLSPGGDAAEDTIRNGIHLATPEECANNKTPDPNTGRPAPYPCWSGGGTDPGYLPWRWTYGYVGGYVFSAFSPLQYVIFDGIDFDGRGITTGVFSLSCNTGCTQETWDGPQHIRFQNLEIRNSIASCTAQPGPASLEFVKTDLQFINVKLHGCGVPFDKHFFNNDPAQGLARNHPMCRFYHPWYMHAGGNQLIDSETYDSCGTGVGPAGQANILRGNYIHDNASHGIQIIDGDTEGWIVEDNLVVNNGGIGVEVYGRNSTVRHNTIIGRLPVGNGAYCSYWHTNTKSLLFQDNICKNYEYGVYNESLYRGPSTALNNLFSVNAGKEIVNDKGVPSANFVIQQNNIFNQDPKFVNPAALDFRLQPGSPAIGKATDGGNIGKR